MANLQGWLMETQKWWQGLTLPQCEAFSLAAAFVGTVSSEKLAEQLSSRWLKVSAWMKF
ncbi:MAG: hypothetical protein N2116_04840 [Armatimonadetes bacterium]|nr:hypothetical protein [Armatimonadota bacterium]